MHGLLLLTLTILPMRIYLKSTFIIMAWLSSNFLSAQSCSTTNIFLNSQADVDNFQATYGPCDSITSTGALWINDTSNNITNLSALSGLVYCRWLVIQNCNQLTSLTGLENISQTSISKLSIIDNALLNDVSQLEGIQPHLGDVAFVNNPSLSDLSFINDINAIGTALTLRNMSGITNMDFYSNVTSGGAYLLIEDNVNLTDVSGLSALTVFGNGSSGIFRITGNSSLNDCSPVCSLVKNTLPQWTTTTVDIQNNLGDCIDEDTVIANCPRSTCNQSIITLVSQAQVNSFQNDYGPCDSIPNRLTITGGDISDLGRLSKLEQVSNLWIENNPILEKLDGLDGFDQPVISSLRIIGNNQLTDISGLQGIGTAVGNLAIVDNANLSDLSRFSTYTILGELTIRNNPEVYNLDPFSNITLVSRSIAIQNNARLNSISGLGGTSFGTAASGYFIIEDNPMLFDCSPVCNIVTNIIPSLDPASWILTIQNNLGPCLDEASLYDACCEHPDYTALEAFYNSTTGDGWIDNSGWLADCDPCGISSGSPWYGVVCNANNRVTELRMTFNNLNGPIPDEIVSLEFLYYLQINAGNVIPEFPEILCNMPALEYIGLARCNMNGTVPPCISKLPKLNAIYIYENNLSGPLPPFDAGNTSLIQFWYNDNNFTGQIPASYGDVDKWANGASGSFMNSNNNSLSGAFDPNLVNLCSNPVPDSQISDGNSFESSWSAFCASEPQPCGQAYVHLPDNAFEQKLIDIGIDSEGVLDGCVKDNDIGTVTVLDVSSSDITNLSGIQHFYALERLIVNENVVNITDQLKSNIELVYVKGNK